MAGRKDKEKAARGPSRPRRIRVGTAEDRSFGEVLRSRSTDRIVPETAKRLEAGRRLYVQGAVTAAAAELELLTQERARLEEEGGGESPRLARLDGWIAAVDTDLAAGRAVLEEIERSVVPEPKGWNVRGRVLIRGAAVPEAAEVVFVDEANKVVKELGVLEPGKDGIVRGAFPAEVVEQLVERGAKIRAAVRVGRRIVATDERPVSLRLGQLHQFDLRVEPGFDPRPTAA